MPRPAVDIEAAAELGRHLTELHDKSGRPGFDRIAKDLYKNYGFDIAGETLRKMHAGKIDPRRHEVQGALLVLTLYYGVGPKALGPTAAERLEWAHTLDVTNWPWITECAGQMALVA